MDEQGIVLAVQFMFLKKNLAVPATIPRLVTQLGKLGKAPRLLHRLFGLGAAAEEPPFILPPRLEKSVLGGPAVSYKSDAERMLGFILTAPTVMKSPITFWVLWSSFSPRRYSMRETSTTKPL